MTPNKQRLVMEDTARLYERARWIWPNLEVLAMQRDGMQLVWWAASHEGDLFGEVLDRPLADTEYGRDVIGLGMLRETINLAIMSGEVVFDLPSAFETELLNVAKGQPAELRELAEEQARKGRVHRAEARGAEPVRLHWSVRG